MAVKFSPSGVLDIATDPSDLPEETDGKAVASGAMTHCKNLRLDQAGLARTRHGSSKASATAITEVVSRIVEQGGNRYAYGSDAIFKNEASIDTGNANAPWSCTLYNPYNVTTQAIFGLNGTDRLKIEDATVYEWGIDPPAAAPVVIKGATWIYTYDWEAEAITWINGGIGWLDTEGYQAYTYDWELTSGHLLSGIPLKITMTDADATPDLECLYSWEHTDLGISQTDDAHVTQPARKLTETVICLTDSEEYEAIFHWEVGHLEGDDSLFDEDYSFEYTYFFEYSDDTLSKIMVKYTYARYDSAGEVLICESNPSAETEVQAESGPGVTWVASSDPQVTHVRLYRTLGDGATYLYHSKHVVTDLSTALYLRDEELGTELETDHDRPPAGGTICIGPNFDGKCFIIKDNFLYYCKAQQPEYWPELYYTEIGPPQRPGKALVFYNGLLFTLTIDDIYQLQGTGSNTFFPISMRALTGCVGQNAVCAVVGKGIFHLSRDGIYLFSGSVDYKFSDARFGPIFLGETAGTIPPVNKTHIENCWLFQYRKSLWFAYPGNDSVYCDNFLVWDIQAEKAVHYAYGTTFTAFTWDRTNNRLLAVDETGYVWELEDESVTEDDGTVISWDLRSKEFNYLRRFFPRFARWDVEPVNGTVATGSVILDGVSKQTHPISSRSNKKRLVDTCNGERLSIAIAGTGPVTIYAAEVD